MTVSRNPDPLDAPEYRILRVQQALARDPRTLELGLEVSVRGDQLFVTGSVASESRRTAAADVIGETLPSLNVHNHITVMPQDQLIVDEQIE
jgi:hypothetical protein